jgi:indole-3-glycerol phosphate synthase
MSNFLKRMATLSAERAAAAKRRYRAAELDLPLHALTLRGFDLIAELKDNSPSEGALAGSGSDRLRRAGLYASGGAAAVSVLTEPSRFAGELSHLSDVARFLAPLGIPAMRKDFLVARVQVLEARAAGASGVLLIAAMLDDVSIVDLLATARDLGMFVLLEAFDERDLKRIARLLGHAPIGDQARAGQLFVGVNTRNLRTLAVDAGRLRALSPLLPAGVACVAESGLANAADAAGAADLGYRLALVGSALMRSDKPDELIRDMLAAGRARSAA